MRARRCLVALAALAGLVTPGHATSQDWPMARRDRERTGLQTLPGDIDTPAVKYAIPLGGAPAQWLVSDVDLDGQPDVVLLRGGRAVARRFDGTLLWASEAFGLGSLRAIVDFDGDGAPEVYAGSALQGLFVLDGRTGDLVWKPEWSPEQRLGDVFPLDADGDGRSELYVTECRSGGRGTGRIYAFAAGEATPASHVALDLAEHGYWCGSSQAAGDLDGDGLPEIVSLSDDRIVVYDPRTGDPRLHSPPLGRFPYARGSVSVRDLDGDGRSEIVVTSNDGTAGVATSKRILILALEGSEIRVQWSRVFDSTEGLHQFVRDPVADVIPGGPLEVVTSAYEPASGWSLLVISGDASASSAPVLTIPGRMLVALADVTGDGRIEIVTIDASTASVPVFGTLRALRLVPGSPPTAEEVWRHENASLSLEPSGFGSGARPIPVDGGVLLRRDTDGDGRADSLLSSGSGGPTRAPSAHAIAARTVDASTSRIAASRVDGYVELLDNELGLLNGTAAGNAALREQSHSAPGLVVGSGATGPILVTGDGDQALVGFAVVDGEAAQRWQRHELLTGGGPVSPSFAWVDGHVAFHVRRPGGALDLALVDGNNGATSSSPFQLADSSVVAPLGSPFQLGTGHLLQALYSKQTALITYLRIDPASGASVTAGLGRALTTSFDRPPTMFDFGADGSSEIVVSQGSRLTVADGATAEPITDLSSGVAGGVATATDLDGDGTTDMLFGAGFGVQRLAADLTRVWALDLTERHESPAAAPTAEGMRVAAPRRELPLVTILRGDDGTVVARRALAAGRAFDSLEEAGATGAALALLTGAVAVEDLTGAGQPAFVLGSTDGHLYALAGEDGALLWSLPLRSALGDPIAADFDGDGATDILVPASDGHVYVVGRANLEAPEVVYDTDGTFLAARPEEDLDFLDSASMVGANWAAVPGATHYSYQIVREDDVVVVPWTDAGAETRFARADLALQRRRRYVTLVRAYDRSGARPRVSAEAASDGFVVADAAIPEVEVTADPAVIWLDAGGSLPAMTEVRATFRDDVGLDSYRLYVTHAEGGEVVELAGGPTGGTEQTLVRPWEGIGADGASVPAGRYAIIGQATDGEGRSGEASAPVTVCTADADLPECELPADGGGPGSDSGPSDAGPSGPWQVQGGGCQCTVSGSTAPPLLPLSLVLLGLVRCRWRRSRAKTTR